MKQRDSVLDVFRCLAMFLIVLGHVYQYGTYYHVSKWFDLVFGLYLCWHVDAFLALSGWFGIKFTVQKFVRLWGVIALYSVVSLVIGRCCFGMSVPFRITGGWYGNTYLCLMLVVPLLNAGIEGLIAKGRKTAWLAWCGFAAVMWINWLSGNSYIGLVAYDIGPFSLVQMVFVYFTVRLVRLTNVAEMVRVKHLLTAILVFFACAIVMPASRTNYIAPYTIVMAIAMLLLFEKYVRVPNWLEKVCVWAAPSMFGVYLLHDVTSFGKMFYRAPMSLMIDLAVPSYVVVILCAIICFCVCFSIEFVRKVLFELVIKAKRTTDKQAE